MKKPVLVACCLLLLLAFPCFAAGSLHTVTPCRIVATSAPLALGYTYIFSAVMADSSTQGGQAIDCGVPASASAIMASIVAVEPVGSGAFRAWPAEGPEPLVAVALNYFKAADVGTPAYTPAPGRLALIGLGVGDWAGKFEIEAYYTSARLIVDVEGYVD